MMFEPEGVSCRLRSNATSIWRYLRLTLMFAMTILCGCASSRGSASKPPSSAAQHEGHIFVTSGTLDGTCYQELGQITLKEPYAQSVIASADSQAEQLRGLARKDYGPRVEAIINVHEHQNEAGTAVDITGDAVQLQNQETVTCAARGMPAVLDSASAAAAGGIVGTVIGGLSQSGGSVYGAEAGGAIGAAAAAGNEIAKRRQQQQSQEAAVSDRLEQQRYEIAQLYQQLTKLIGQQCNDEELSEEECEHRMTAVQQQIPQTATAQASEPSSKPGNTAGPQPISEFGILNQVQEQQEIIDQLRQRIAQIKQDAGNR